MTLFQGIAITGVCLVLLVDLRYLLTTSGRRGFILVRCTLWILAGVCIAQPQLPSTMANWVGIHRGADLVLYVFALTFLAAMFYFYSRYIRLQRQLTEVVRHMAIREARRGEQEP